MKKMIGKKKSLSTFTRMSSFQINGLEGIQTRGGVLYQIEGTILLNSKMDTMTKPDMQGRRWISLKYSTYGEYGELDAEFTSFVKKALSKIMPEWLSIGENLIPKDVKAKLIAAYVEAAEKFVSKNKTKIRNFLGDYHSYSVDEWNEILVNNIKIKDILYKQVNGYSKEQLATLNSNLKKIASGNVYIMKDNKDIYKFIQDRGGIIDS